MPQQIDRDECPTPAQLAEYGQGLLTEEDSERIESHLAGCDTCEATMAVVDAKVGTVVTPKHELPPDPYEGEEARDHAVEAAERVGREPGTETLQREADEESYEELGQYRLLEKLGEGGMGAVYKALHTRLDKVVALKRLPAAALKDESAVARFEREMRAVGKLQHQNIVGAHDAGDVDGTHYLVMELVEGRDLSAIVNRQGALPAAAACELARQAALGLQHAHEHGMVHRDIKPSNLMLTNDGVVKILDMGLALLAEQHTPGGGELTGTGQLMGTLDYMAPEQGADTHNVDIRADVYSLGATLYKLLVGRAPFGGEKYTTPIRKLQALATKEPERIDTLRPDLPAGLADVVHRMLAKEPGDRYATPADVVAALEPYADGDLSAVVAGTAPVTSILESVDHDEDAPTQLQDPSRPAPELEPTLLGGGDAPTAAPSAAADGETSGRPPWTLIGGLGAAAAAVVFAVVFFLKGPDGTTIRVEVVDPKVKVELAASGFVLTRPDEKPVTIEPGDHTLRITAGELTFTSESFTINKGEDVVVRVEIIEGDIRIARADGGAIGARPDDPANVAGVDPKPVTDGSVDPTRPDEGEEPLEKPVWWPIETVEVPTLAERSAFDDLQREDIDPAELAAAEAGGAMPGLVAILGDSRFAHTERITGLDFDPATGELVTTTNSGIAWWSMETGRRSRWIDDGRGAFVLSDPYTFVRPERGNQMSVGEGPEGKQKFAKPIDTAWTAIAVQPDGRAAVLGFKDGSFGAWSTESGEKSFGSDPPPEGEEHGTVGAIAFAPNGEWLAIARAGTNVSLHSAKDGTELRTLKSPASACVVSPDGTRIATALGKNAFVWNAETGGEVFSTPETDTLLGLAFSPDGGTLATVSAGTLILWDAVEGKLLRRIESWNLTGPVVFTPDSKQVVAARVQLNVGGGLYGYSAIGIWDVENGDDVLDRRGPAGPVNDVHFTDDGHLRAISTDTSLTTWNVGTREITARTNTGIANVVTGEFNEDGSIAFFGQTGQFTRWDVERDIEHSVFRGHYFNPARFILHGDGSTLASLGDFGSRAMMDAAETPAKFSGNEATFTPDGRTLVAAGSDVHGHDIRTGEALAGLELSDGVKRLRFTPDGRFLVTADRREKVIVRETRGMTRVRELNGAKGVAADIAFSRDARYVATVTPAAVVVWDLQEKSSQPLATFDLGTPFTQGSWQGIENNVALEFTPEGRHVVLGRRNGTIQVFRIAEGG